MVSGTHSMNLSASISTRMRLLIVFALLVIPLNESVVSAQSQNSYSAELMEWTIDVSGPNYVLQNADLEEYPHGRGERIYITSVDSLGFVEVSFFDDEDTPEQTIELMLRDFDAASRSLEVLDSGIENGIHYALARFELEQGMNGYFYIEVAEDINGNVDLSQSIYTLDVDFEEQLAIARSEISLAGLPFLADPVSDIETILLADQALLASTPEPMATPDQGSYTFGTNEAELVVQGDIEFDFPLTNRELDIMFLSSAHGYGVVGFIHQDAEAPEMVLSSVFIGGPVGDEAPEELFTESDDSRAFGVYRVSTQGETRAMIIEVISIDEGLWQIQAIAVTESEFSSSLESYQGGVIFNGEPLLGDINADEIISILNDAD